MKTASGSGLGFGTSDEAFGSRPSGRKMLSLALIPEPPGNEGWYFKNVSRHH